MYMKTTLWKLFSFFAGAILFMAFITPVAHQVFVYATRFAVNPIKNLSSPSILPYQYRIFSPFAALLAGAVAGSLWAWVLSRIPEKSAKALPPRAHTKLWYAIGGFLLAMPVLLLLFSRVTALLLNILPPNSRIFIALFWLLCVVCFFLKFMPKKTTIEKSEPKKKMRWLPLLLFSILIVCVLFCMLLQFYPISSSLDFLMQTKDLTDRIIEEISFERHLAYRFHSDTWIHLVVVAGCAFILGGWQTKCLRMSHAN